MAADLPLTTAQLVEIIRERAGRGESDVAIGATTGFTRSWIGEVRRAAGIRAGTSQRGNRIYNELDPAELAYLKGLAAREYLARPRTGLCVRCRRLLALTNDHVPVHPALGTTPQQHRPCTGSWLRPADIDHESAERVGAGTEGANA